jgi:hypothetical protein
MKPGKLAQAIKLLTCIRTVFYSNLAQDTDYPDRILVVFLIPSNQVAKFAFTYASVSSFLINLSSCDSTL